jgi:hypothetical protein
VTTTIDSWSTARRLGGLRRFGAAITVFNLLGHTVFGFEQSWAQPLLSLATAYACELFVEWFDARANRRRPRFTGGWKQAIDFLLPAHITGLAVAMLLYASDHVLPVMFAAAVAIASKATFRVAVKGSLRHIFNPSNFGITVTLLMFPWVGIAPPYHFTENLSGAGSLILPAIIFCSGSFINYRFTARLPLVLGWWGGFMVQAALRSALLGTPLLAAFNPMTGVAFVLFSFYMISDPATTPFSTRGQIIFGVVVAAAYGLLVYMHVPFGLFFALTTVSAVRGLVQAAVNMGKATASARMPAPQPVTVMQKHA